MDLVWTHDGICNLGERGGGHAADNRYRRIFNVVEAVGVEKLENPSVQQ